MHALQHGQLGDVHAHAGGEVDVVDGGEVGDGRVGGERPGVCLGAVGVREDGGAGVCRDAGARGVVFEDFLVAGGYAAAVSGSFDFFEAFCFVRRSHLTGGGRGIPSSVSADQNAAFS